MSAPWMISIPIEEYNMLVEDSMFLCALEEAGVNNWEGYSEAIRIMEEE